MDCKRAEAHLSAYLDGVLPPDLMAEVAEHVESCPNCKPILDDYRRFDAMLTALPRVEPPADLGERLFSSPAYKTLLRELEEEEETEEEGAADDTPRRTLPRRLTTVSRISRVLLPVAAVLVLALGGVLFARGSFLGTQPGTSSTQTTIGNPGGSGVPLALGTRLVYERDGALWSASDDGKGIGQQLTPAGVRVVAWTVSPSGGQDGAGRIAYLDDTGAIHVVRADGLEDAVVAHVFPDTAAPASYWGTPAGDAVAAGLAWSPDGTRLAYIYAPSRYVSELHTVNARGVGDVTALINTNTTVVASAPRWSPDSLYVAFTTTDTTGAGTSGARNLWVYGVATGKAQKFGPVSGNITQLAWVPGVGQPTLTWATSDASGISALYAASVDAAAATATTATQLTPTGAHYAAAFAPNADGTLWLAAEGNKLLSISVVSGQVRTVATMPSVITSVAWSPNGNAAVVAGARFVAVWMPGRALATVTPDAAIGPLAWSADSKTLAYVADDAIVAVPVSGGASGASGTVGSPKTLAHLSGTTALRWSPDGVHLAAATASAVYLIPRDGSASAAVDSHAATDNALDWTNLK